IVQEGATTRTFMVTLEPGAVDAAVVSNPANTAQPAVPVEAAGTQVFSTFAGSVEIVDVLVKVGDAVSKGDIVAAVEAMKAKHDIKAPCSGKVSAIHVEIGDEVDSSKPIMTIS
ncbi:MAG: hypothetical protein JSU69_04505, partial [Candidatus Zixiibacteriota bacterium]